MYIDNAWVIGALYCIVPSLVWFIAVFVAVPFREVYLLRLALCVIVGGYIGARLNVIGLRAWLNKHTSSRGPATVFDGVIAGSLVGLGIALLPPLTSLIATNHPEEARRFIVFCWTMSLLMGGAIGGVLAIVGIRQIPPGGKT